MKFSLIKFVLFSAILAIVAAGVWSISSSPNGDVNILHNGAALERVAPTQSLAILEDAIRSARYAENDIAVPKWGDSAGTLPKVGDVLHVEFFKDKAVDITVGAAKAVSLNGKSGAVVRGKTPAGKGFFDATYVVYGGRSRVVFDDFTNNKTFELTYDYAQNSYVAIETEKPKMSCATCAAIESVNVSADSAKISGVASDAPMSASLLGKTHVIDYMLVFDTASTAAAGGADGITTRALSIVGNMNNCFSNTKIDSEGTSIDAEYNLVKAMTLESSFVDVEGAVTGVRNSVEVRNARADCSADLVGFIVIPTAGGSTSGLATLGADRSSAFSAATYYSAESTYTAAHEAAHNFGCEHSREQLGGAGTHAYAVGANIPPYCTIMSYGVDGADTRVPVFSGPYSVWNGVTMGSATMDNARRLTENIPAGTAFDGGADLSLDVASWEPSDAGETKDVTVALTESATNSFWKVETTAEWLSFSDISYDGIVNSEIGKDGNPIETIEADEGKGPGSFVIRTSGNVSTSPRSAEVRVSIIGTDNNTFEKIIEFTRVITVTQAGAPPLECSLSETRKEIRLFDPTVPLSWMSAGTPPRVGDTIAVQFFDDVSYNLTAAFTETILAGTKPALLVHARTAPGAPINASYIICDGKIRVDVRDFDKDIHYTLAWDSEHDAYVARTFGEGDNPTTITPSGVASNVNNLSAATVFDWMAVYDTRGAASASLLGGVQMNSLATYATLNAALVNSVVYDKRFRYVGAFASTTYTANDSGTSAAGPNAFSKALADIESGSTLADEVDDLRMKNGADLVSLLIDPEARSVGGLSNLGPSSLSVNSDFSVVRTSEAVWALTAIHEIGHNFGMGHNATDHGRDSYAFGAIATPYHSIMSYGAGTNRVPFFSGADSVCNGVAITQTSDGSASNNVLMLGMSAASVATHLVPTTTACPDSPEATPLGSQGSTQTAPAGTLSLPISTNTIATSVGAWTISDYPSWMSFDKTSDTGTGTVALSFTENTTGHSRTGTFVFSAKINGSEEYSTFLYTLTQDSVRTNLWVDGVTVNDSDWKTTDNSGYQLTNSVGENISTVPTSWRNILGGEITYFNQNGWYDVNKYTMNPEAAHSDSNMCWAVSAANLVQWWLDRNKNFISDFDSIPSGYSTLTNTRGGEHHTNKIYDDFCANFENVNGAKAIYGIWWYMSGFVHADVPYRTAVVPLTGADTYATRGGYLASRMTLKSGATNVGDVLDNLTARIDYDDSGTVAERAGYYEKFSSDLAAAIRAKKGIMISIPGHALTAWGAEFDGDGNATALYISDSDNNAYYGIVKYSVSKGTSGEFAGYAILDYEGLENQAIGTLMTLDQGEGLFESIAPAVSDTADFTNFAGKEQADFGDFTGVSSGGFGNYTGFSISTGAFAEKGGNWGTSAYLTSITIARAGNGNGSTPLYFNVYTTPTPTEAGFVGQASTTVSSGGSLTNDNAAEFVTADFSGLQLNENTTYYVFFSTVVSGDVYAFASNKLRIRLGKTADGLTGSNVVYSNTTGATQGNNWMPIYSLAFSAVEPPRPVVTAAELSASTDVWPVMVRLERNAVLRTEVTPSAGTDYAGAKYVLNISEGFDEIESISLWRSTATENYDNTNYVTGDLSNATKSSTNAGFITRVSEIVVPAGTNVEIPFLDSIASAGTDVFYVSVKLKSGADLDKKIGITLEKLILADGSTEIAPTGTASATQRIGYAIAIPGDSIYANSSATDATETSGWFRIPGIANSAGTLVSVFDIRYESNADIGSKTKIDSGASRSLDGGKTWSRVNIAAKWGDNANFASATVYGISDPSIISDGNNLYLFGLGGKGLSASAVVSDVTSNTTGQFVLTKSTDSGATWGTPISVNSQIRNSAWKSFFQGPGHGIVLKHQTGENSARNGWLVLPAQMWIGSTGNGYARSCIIYSEDGGATWKSQDNILNHTGTANAGIKVNASECSVVELSDGTLMLSARSEDATFKRQVYTTTDMGATWTAHATNQTIPAATCQGSLFAVENGGVDHVLLFSAPNSEDKYRNPMTLRVSYDDGATWRADKEIIYDRRGICGYSDICPADDSHVGVIYEGAADSRQIFFLRIPVSEFAPQLTIDKTTETVPATTSDGVLTVTSDEAWTVSSSAEWLVPATTAGTNNGSVAYSISPSTETAERTASLTVSVGNAVVKTFTVTQQAYVVPPRRVLGIDFGNATTTTAGTNWYNVSAGTVKTATTGFTAQNIKVNGGAESTTALLGNYTIAVSHKTSSAAGNAVANHGVNSGEPSGTGDGKWLWQEGSKWYGWNNQSAAALPWGLESDNSAIVSSMFFMANGAANATANGKVTIGGLVPGATYDFTFYVGGDVPKYNQVAITSASADYTLNSVTPLGSTTGTTSGQTFSAGENSATGDNYIAVKFSVTPAAGVSSLDFEIIKTANASAKGYIRLNAMTIDCTAEVLELGSAAWNTACTAGTTSVAVTASDSWTATSSDGTWLTVSPSSAGGSSSATISVTANPNSEARTGSITFTDDAGTVRTFSVTQDGFTANAGFGGEGSETSATWFPENSSGSTSIPFKSNIAWTAVSDAEWLTVSPTSGTGNANLDIDAEENTTPAQRVGHITITAGTITRVITVTQAAGYTGDFLFGIDFGNVNTTTAGTNWYNVAASGTGTSATTYAAQSIKVNGGAGATTATLGAYTLGLAFKSSSGGFSPVLNNFGPNGDSENNYNWRENGTTYGSSVPDTSALLWGLPNGNSPLNTVLNISANGVTTTSSDAKLSFGGLAPGGTYEFTFYIGGERPQYEAISIEGTAYTINSVDVLGTTDGSVSGSTFTGAPNTATTDTYVAVVYSVTLDRSATSIDFVVSKLSNSAAAGRIRLNAATVVKTADAPLYIPNGRVKNYAIENSTSDIVFPVPANAWNLASGALTTDLWISPNSATSAGTILTLGDASLKISNGIISLESSAGTLTGTHTALAAKSWHHVAIVTDGSALKLFVDKAEVASTSNAAQISALQNNWSGIVFSKDFDGRRDELRCWARAFAGTEFFTAGPLSMAQSFYNTLVGEWRFDQDLTDSKWTTQDGSSAQRGATDVPYHAVLPAGTNFSEVTDNADFRYVFTVGYIRGNHILWESYSREHLISSSELIYMSVSNDAAGNLVYEYPDNDATSIDGVSRLDSFMDSAGTAYRGVMSFADSGSVGMNVGTDLFLGGDKSGKNPGAASGSTNFTVETKLCVPAGTAWPAGARIIENECVSIRFGETAGTVEVQIENGLKDDEGAKIYDGTWAATLPGYEAGKWFHLAVAQNAGTPTVYFNKTAMTTSAVSTTETLPAAGTEIVVGKNFFGGKMDYLRVWKNEARGVSTFDVAPKAGYADQTIVGQWEGEVLGRDSASWVSHIRKLRKSLVGTTGNSICLGLGNGTQAWKTVMPNATLRKALAASLKAVYDKYGPNGTAEHVIDGFDVDFEWIESSSDSLWTNYGQQLVVIRDALGPDALFTCTLHKYYYYLPATVTLDGVQRSVFDACDYFSCQNYGPSSDLTNYSSFTASMNEYLGRGFPREKIVLSTALQTAVPSSYVANNAASVTAAKPITTEQRGNFVKMWRDVLKVYPEIADSASTCNLTWNGITIPVSFIGVDATKQRAQFVCDNTLPGIMYWDLGEDVSVNLATGTGNTDYFSSKSLVAALNSVTGTPVRPTGDAVTVLSVSPQTASVEAAGTEVAVDVSSNSAWTVSSNDSGWITISPTSGAGAGTISLTVAENAALTPRTATITITSGEVSETVVVTQAAADENPYEVWVGEEGKFPAGTPDSEKTLDASPAGDGKTNLEKFVFDATGTLDPTKPSGGFGTAGIVAENEGTPTEKDFLQVEFPFNRDADGVVELEAQCLADPTSSTPTWTNSGITLTKDAESGTITLKLNKAINESDAPAKQAVRLRGTLAGVSFETVPYGYSKISLAPSTKTILGLQVHHPHIFVKDIPSGGVSPFVVAGTKISINNADFAGRLDPAKSYIVEVLTGSEENRVSAPFIINRSAWRNDRDMSIAGTTVSFESPELVSYLTSGVSPVAYRVRPAITLQDVFGTPGESGMKPGNAGTADTLMFKVGSSVSVKFFVNRAGAWSGGVALVEDGAIASEAPIFTHDAIVVNRKAGETLTYVVSGEVLTDNQRVQLGKGYNYAASGLLFSSDTEEAALQNKKDSETHSDVESSLR